MKSQFTKYRVPAACLVTILLAGVAPAIATAATTTTRYQFKGLTAELYFPSTSGSIETDVFIYATQGQGLSLEVYQYDLTNYNLFFDYFGELSPTSSQFQISSSLQSASLNVAGAVLEDFVTGNLVTADVSVTWTGSGAQPSAISKNDFTYQTVYPGHGLYGSRYHSTGMMREAIAGGSFVINGTDFLAGVANNFYYANLSKSSSGEIDIIKPF